MIGSILRYLGIDDVSGPWYAWWSGAGSDLAYLGIIWAILRRHNCHVTRCWRIGRFPAGEYHVCSRHHPGPVVTQRTVSERYHLYLGQRPGKG